MKFEYQINSINLKRSALLIPPWVEMKDIKISKDLNIINGLDKKYFTYREDEICVGDLFSNQLINENSDIYEKAYRYILSDYRWVMLCERKWFNFSTNYLVKIRELVIGSVNYIKAKNLKFLFSVTVPHAIEIWVFSKIFEKFFSGTIFLFDYSAIPGFVSIYKGIDKFEAMDIKSQFLVPNLENDKHALDYIKLSRSSSKTRDSNGLISWLCDLDGYNKWKKISTLRQIPQRIIQKLYSNFIFRKYNKLSFKGIKISKNSVVYFMHYQPEATSLPIGQYFIEQSNAINSLRMALPKEYKIYIKEHPYQYTQPIDPRFRPPKYYELINKIDNVEFINPMYPSYDLIDQTKIVATLTGKVGFQALLRGKPVICFGLSSYQNHEGCHFYNNQTSLKEFIKETKNINFEKATSKFLSDIENTCISGYEYVNGKLPTLDNSVYWQARKNAIIKILVSLFEIN